MKGDSTDTPQATTMRTLPGDPVRRILWRFADRPDLQKAAASARSLARGAVARMVAEGARRSHEWTEQKSVIHRLLDEAGITALGLDPEHGGHLEGPKNMAFALTAFEMAWVDGGAATSSMATNLAMSPIHERGTPEQVANYMPRCAPPGPGEDRKVWRGSFALTEPLPYVGVNTGVLSGKVSVAEWEEGEEPVLQVEKRGRFITNMAVADFVTAAVDTGDERIRNSCVVILEAGDEGSYDRGEPSRKLVHQLSSTRDPVFSLRVPASRIIGGYTVKDGVIVPKYSHSEVIAAVFRRTRVTIGLMTAAKLLSAVEPIIRYHRTRFRGAEAAEPGTPRYDLGLQQKEDVLHRLVDVWAAGEAAASLGFATARLFDELDPMEKRKDQILEERGVTGFRAQMGALRKTQKAALEYLMLESRPPTDAEGQARFEELRSDLLVRYAILDAQANVLCPATKLWNTGHGATIMREAVSLVGGVGITEECPGFLGQKWMDAQLEATYEGPEAVQRLQIGVTMTNQLFLAQYRRWIAEMRAVADRRPGTGACTIASAMELWLWALEHILQAKDAEGRPLYHKQRQGVTFPLADALCWLLAARAQVLDLVELEEKGPGDPAVAEGLEGTLGFLSDLCHVQAARAAGEASRICTELVFGYNRHPGWDDGGEYAYVADDLEGLEGVMSGFAACARAMGDVIESDGSHPAKAGPCVRIGALEPFVQLRSRLDTCMTGCRLAKDRAAHALTRIEIPEALDYPA